MKFQSAYPEMNVVYSNGKEAKFENGFLETEDEELIQVLRKDKSVMEVSSITETLDKSLGKKGKEKE